MKENIRRTCHKIAATLVKQIKEQTNQLRIKEELLKIKEDLAKNEDLSIFFKLPAIKIEDKKKILKEYLKDTSEEVIGCLEIMLDINIISSETLEVILTEYTKLCDELQNKIEINVITNIEMKSEQLAKLKEKISSFLDKEVKLVNVVDPSILGGVILKIKDKIIDGSIKKQLEILEKELAK